MTKISMKALLGAGAMAVIAAVSLSSGAQAQGQPGTMPNTTDGTAAPGTMSAAPSPGYMGSADQPGAMAPAPQPNGSMPPQNAYVQPQQGTTAPSQFHQLNPRYPGPAVN
ncbi:MAG TPA: hypothetical protein VHW66_20555 [Stellaceae bacterium]|jgi:hypothetical protein|nr:hypothetical protein [Stellaceae bacterium]